MSLSKKILHVILALALMLTVLPAVSLDVHATEVTEVTAVMTGDPSALCEVGQPVSAIPTFTLDSPGNVTLGDPEWECNGMQVSASASFSSGIWTLWIPVVLNEDDHPGDTLSSSVTFKTGETEWKLERFTPADAEDPNWIAWFRYPTQFDRVNAGELNFVKDHSWDIPVSYVDQPIKSFDVSAGVSGGGETHRFDKDLDQTSENLEWISVSPEGVVSGTPTGTYSDYRELVIKVTDSDLNERRITLLVDETRENDPRTPITEVKMTSPKTLEEIAKYETTIVKPGVKMNSFGHLKEYPVEEYWEYKVTPGSPWEKVNFDGLFKQGEYRYHIKVEVKDEDKATFCLQNPKMKDESTFNEWTLVKCSIEDGTAEYASQTVKVEIPVNKLNFKGIAVPLDGELPSKTFTLQEEGVVINTDDIHWYVEETDGTWSVCDGVAFDTANRYKIAFLCKADKGYMFPDPTYAMINTKNATVDRHDEHELLVEAIIPAAAVKDALYVVTAGSLNIRDTASYMGNRLGGLKYGDVVRSIGVSGRWIMIEFAGSSAWICGDYAALTYSEETAIDPVNATINVGAINVREEPDAESTRIGGFTGSKVVLVTGEVTNSKNELWLVVDYDGQLGFIKATYTDYEKAETDQDQYDLVVHTGGVPAKVTLEAVKSAIAYGTDANLTDEHFNCIGDEAVEVDIYPDDGENYSTLKVENISLPDDPTYMVEALTLNADGSVHLRLIPKDSVSLTFDTDGGTEVKERTVSKGNTVEKPEDPAKEGYTFDAWYGDEAFAGEFDFAAPINADTKAYARFMKNIKGVKAHISGTEKDSDGHIRPKADELAAVFEKDTADVTVSVSPLYSDSSLTTALSKEPEAGKDYWLTVTMECKGGEKPECFYLDSIKTGGVFEADDAVIEAVSFDHKDGSSVYTVTLKYLSIGYVFSKGADSKWTRGSSAGLEITVNRTAEDDKTFGLFTGIEVDGKALASSDYEAKAGSLNAVIKSSYLNSLSEGTHKIKVNFKDGSAETTVTVDPAKSAPAVKNTDGSPKTGDESKPQLWGTIAAVALVAVAALAFAVIRSRKSDKK